jgi:hypothetical protein
MELKYPLPRTKRIALVKLFYQSTFEPQSRIYGSDMPELVCVTPGMSQR